MRDRSKQLLVINTGKKESEQTRLPAQSGTTHIIGGGGLSVNISDYLLKSIWDKVWEIRTDSQGAEYIFGKLPMVTQYGITMYSGEGVNVPSLASGLPFDGRTIWYNPETQQIEVIGGTGGGSGEGVSNFWDLSGIPSWITKSKPKYTYSEIEGTPDLSVFATQNWIIRQGYASAEELKKYIPISGYTEVSGEKNFTGGLKVNGSPIYYDTEKKYWKLEGDLLVTGGVTMYGSDSSFTPSTIMDALLYDDATLGINSNGQLYVKGGTGGGLDITALQNYLTSNSYLNVTGGDNRYLKLSGGTLTNTLTIDNSNVGLILHRSGQSTPYIRFGQDTNNEWGELGVYHDGRLVFWPLVSSQGGYNQWNTVWHEGNFKPSNYLPLSGGTINGDFGVLKIKRSNQFASGIGFSNINGILGYIGYNDDGSACIWGADLLGRKAIIHSGGGTIESSFGAFEINRNDPNASAIKYSNTSGILGYIGINNDYSPMIWNESKGVLGVILHSGNIGSYNAGSATKLQTARTIWGQSFDGTGNVTGQLNITTGSNVTLTYGTGLLTLGTMASAHIAIDTNDIQAKSNGTTASTLYLNDYGGNVSMCGNGGNVGIGTTNPQQKLHVEGHVWANGDIAAKTKIHAFGNLIANDNVGIGTESPSAKLHIVNNTNTSTGLRLDGGWSGYGFLYNGINIFLNGEQYGGIGVNTVSSAYGSTAAAGTYITNAKSGEYMNFYNEGGVFLKANLLVNGVITMYSDQRKKTILNHVELSLKQIANAPLIEHYYNSDEKKTTHVGSIAQYWASMNDWFCKLDSEGYYTMEIQNAALASAISIARELDRYETKTDNAIKKMKKRICELEEEVEQLKAN